MNMLETMFGYMHPILGGLGGFKTIWIKTIGTYIPGQYLLGLQIQSHQFQHYNLENLDFHLET